MSLGQTLSVLMPNYNHARFLPQALDAILAQSRQPDEIVVVDDASTDSSLEVLEGYASRHPSLKIVRNERNLGVVRNLNRLVGMCSSTHGAFLAADDVILPGMFERTMSLFTSHPRAGLCSGLTRSLGIDGQERGVIVTPVLADEPGYVPPERAARFILEEGQWIVNNTCTYRMEALRDAGGFHEELLAFSDGLVSDVVALRNGVLYIPDELAYWRDNPNGFASRTCSDIELITEVMRRALRLMKTRYADVYTPELRERFRATLCKRHNKDIRLEHLDE